MKIGFIGAGKVGFSLGRYMMEQDMPVSGYYSQNVNSAKEAAAFTQTNYYSTMEELVYASDIIFLTVPDQNIKTVWEELKQFNLKNRLICHCSGALSSQVFYEMAHTGGYGYSIHPLYAVHSKTHSYQGLYHCYFTIEGDRKYMDFWKNFFSKLGNPCIELDSQQKTLYHCAAASASNLVLGLYAFSAKLLENCGFSENAAREALRYLFVQNAEHAAEVGLSDALTGPVERGDIDTVRKHLAALNQLEGVEQVEIYRLLSKEVVSLAKDKHPERDYSGLCELLETNYTTAEYCSDK